MIFNLVSTLDNKCLRFRKIHKYKKSRCIYVVYNSSDYLLISTKLLFSLSEHLMTIQAVME